MAVDDPPHRPSRPWHALAGLFEEAWRRERRRRYRYLLLLVLVAAAALTFELNQHGGSAAIQPIAATRTIFSVKAASLPAAGGYTSLSVAGGKLVVVGGKDVDLAEGQCTSAVVDPVTLHVSDVTRASCADPALYHEHVMPFESVVDRSDPTIGNNELLGVRIATVKRGTRNGYSVGPTVMTFPDVSDGRSEWLYGDGSLWIFDPDAHRTGSRDFSGANTGELVRVSTSTGKVLQRWTLPSLDRALLAVNADGLWIAPSLYSGYPIDVTAQDRGLYQTLFLAVPGARSLRQVRELGRNGTSWMIASGRTLWLETGGPSQADVRLRLQGAGGTATAQVRTAGANPQGGEYGEGPSPFAGSTTMGIYDVVPNYLAEDSGQAVGQRIVWMDPRTLSSRTVATLQLQRLSLSLDNPIAVADDGSLYVLNASTSAVAGTGALAVAGPSLIDRITASRRS